MKDFTLQDGGGNCVMAVVNNQSGFHLGGGEALGYPPPPPPPPPKVLGTIIN